MILHFWLRANVKKAFCRLLPLVVLASLADTALLFAVRQFMRILDGSLALSIRWWLCGTLSLVLLRWILAYRRGVAIEKTGRHLETGISIWFVRRVRTLSPKFFHDPESGNRLTVAYDSIRLVSSSAESAMQALQAILQLIIFLPVLFVLSPWLTAVVLLVALPIVSAIQKKLQAMKSSLDTEMAERGNLRVDVERAKSLFRNWSSRPELLHTIENLFREIRAVYQSGFAVGRRKVTLSQGMEAVSVLSVVVILSFCGWMILNERLGVEGLILYCSALFLCYKPVKECARLLPQMRQAKSALNSILELERAPRKKSPTFHEGSSLEFECVRFSYGEVSKPPVFENLSLSLFSTRPVLLQGPNGCGKSTFLKLFAGIEEPDAGKVLLPKSRRGIFFVSQEQILPPHGRIAKALARFEHHKEIQNLNRLLRGDFLLEKSGLSGGERAKVAMLWAAISEAGILLLDEPFAFIAQAEREAILKAFIDAVEARGKWLVMVSHEPVGALAERFETVNLPEILGGVS